MILTSSEGFVEGKEAMMWWLIVIGGAWVALIVLGYLCVLLSGVWAWIFRGSVNPNWVAHLRHMLKLMRGIRPTMKYENEQVRDKKHKNLVATYVVAYYRDGSKLLFHDHPEFLNKF